MFCATEKCKTTSERGFENFVGPQTDVECIFPMKLGGRTYHGCVPDEYSCHWCSTKGRFTKLPYSSLFVILKLVVGISATMCHSAEKIPAKEGCQSKKASQKQQSHPSRVFK